MNNIIETERLILRNWRHTDIPFLIEMNLDKEVMKYFLNIPTEAETLQFYERVVNHFSKHGFGLYVVEDKIEHQFMGYTGFMIANFESDFTPCTEIGWRFKKEYWRKGYATEAAKACLLYGFSTLQFNQVYSFTSLHNKKSEAVMQRIGMKKVGEFSHPKIAKDSWLNLHVKYLIESITFSE
jgi:RimJ/RimL family protein N-acetyltransferase